MSSLEIFNQLDNQSMVETPNGTQNNCPAFSVSKYYFTYTKTVLLWAPYVIDQLSLNKMMMMFALY
jgi:hypothetical protein